MVGLIQKDMCVLRRQLLTLLEVAIGVTVLGVLFFLSAKYGNVTKWRSDVLCCISDDNLDDTVDTDDISNDNTGMF